MPIPRAFVAMVALALLATPSALAAAPASSACTYVLGFRTLHDLIPQVVGDCVTDEYHNPLNGDGLQQSVSGLLVWRKADNWTAFTDGSTTWINGPFGVQSRPNDQRFSWEAPQPTGSTTVNATFSLASVSGDAAAQSYARKLSLKLTTIQAQPGAQEIHLEFANREWVATFKNAGSYVVQNGTPFLFRGWSHQAGIFAPNASGEIISGTDAPYTPGASEVLVVIADATFLDDQGVAHDAKVTTDGLTVTLQ